MNQDLIIETSNLKKTFMTKSKGRKKLVEAVKGVNLTVKRGEVFGFLGPNGAGKSTTQKMLSTLLAPTEGKAVINGYDLLHDQKKIRMCIGYVSQAGGTDGLSTGSENLILQARLYGIDAATAKKRAAEYIERFHMEGFADRKAQSYSGGQRRRLDLALGMIHKPQLLLLDEPTAGLDPQSRAYLWDEINNLRSDGMTVFLTTHYMDEADKLCDTVAIIDNGLIAVQGTPEELKGKIGADIITFGFQNPLAANASARLLQDAACVQEARAKDNTVLAHALNMEEALPQLMRILDAQGLKAQNISLSKPSLDDVFLQYTGRSLREETSNENTP
jgi:ABC-2 type transport system ATP-binding protein